MHNDGWLCSYRSVHYHKNTKNQWARDDPAFLVLLAAFLTVSTALSAVIFKLSFAAFVKLLLWVIFVDCIGVGLVISTLLWAFSNFVLKGEPMAHHVDQSVEFGYAFDIHCNSFFPLFVTLHVVQILLVGVVTKPWFLSVVLANTLWLIALTQYVYITFLGYSALPFLRKTHAFLYPMVPILVVYFLSILLQWNISSTVLQLYGLTGTQDAAATPA
ncbi:hypothetical protein PTSG_04832 [Salpingoeca rosetta]|uniref:Uncharacterized protein n=1 Tax=Salpingoeca rosetta (strain ATCC 50818 / BSB-021) TaxID=946362 RepID=F2U9U2_SALR5|nr:uncharacterized protein PTSG_04832 [Salpingoeca rosetta]EGD73119.1 hypothetical protein PTSG_04832 [Salpingoeca rosetta]|eukprot:XP_004994150.1 hypothetical protein PTSG_04832 [Salpingoeca rosetta]